MSDHPPPPDEPTPDDQELGGPLADAPEPDAPVAEPTDTETAAATEEAPSPFTGASGDKQMLSRAMKMLRNIEPLDPDTGARVPDFWERRPWLSHIRYVAHNVGLPVWSLFGAVLARVSAAIPATVVETQEMMLVRPKKGGHLYTEAESATDTGALNALVVTDVRRGWQTDAIPHAGPMSQYVLLLGRPGSGKSASMAWAEKVAYNETAFHNLHGRSLYARKIESGQAVAEALMAIGDEETVFVRVPNPDKGGPRVYRQLRRFQNGFQVTFTWDESSTLEAHFQRPNNTLAGGLNTMWSGGDMSTHNASEDRRRDVPLTYAASIVVGVQPGTCPRLTTDRATGMAQRMLWLPAVSHVLEDAAELGPPNRIPASKARRELRIPKPPLLADDADEAHSRRFPSFKERRGPEVGLKVTPSIYQEILSSQNEVRDEMWKEMMTAEAQRTRGDTPTEEELFGHGEHTHQHLHRLAALFAFMGESEEYFGWDDVTELMRRGITDEDWWLGKVVMSVSKQTRDVQEQYLAAVKRSLKQMDREDQAEAASYVEEVANEQRGYHIAELLWRLGRQAANRVYSHHAQQVDAGVDPESEMPSVPTYLLLQAMGGEQKRKLMQWGSYPDQAAAGKEGVAYAMTRAWIKPDKSGFSGTKWSVGLESPPVSSHPADDTGFEYEQ